MKTTTILGLSLVVVSGVAAYTGYKFFTMNTALKNAVSTTPTLTVKDFAAKLSA